MDLNQMYIFNGIRYGPGKGVKVPVEFGMGKPELSGKNMAPKKEVEPETEENPLPDDFPHRAQLFANKVRTVEALQKIESPDTLNDIGPKRWSEIQAALTLVVNG